MTLQYACDARERTPSIRTSRRRQDNWDKPELVTRLSFDEFKTRDVGKVLVLRILRPSANHQRSPIVHTEVLAVL